MAYFSMEPWGTETEDWRAGMIASTIANVNRDPKKQKKPFEPKDFVPRRVPIEEQAPEQQAEIMRLWARVLSDK